MATKLKIGILGTCPVCEGEFKTKNGRMVHHGYRRPGWGSIVGDCFAVNLSAYELSVEGCKMYRLGIISQIRNLKLAIETVPFLTHVVDDDSWNRFGRRDRVQYAVGVTDAHIWGRVLESRKSQLEYSIKNCEQAVARMDRLIANWTLKPLREVTEAAAEALAKSEREARAAERQAKRDAKKAKSDALQAKRDTKEAAQQVRANEFVAALCECFDKESGFKVVRRFTTPKKDNVFEYLYLCHCSVGDVYEQLIRLGLAHKVDNGSRIIFDF